MLELKDIKKDYPAGGSTVPALRGLSLKFKKGEFVSILGPSGCGKTTLLNIIGGLDQYTSGDLLIEGRSTKHFKDRDWDTYRNHTIGFVFQSYNLIPHQTVLQNVELALSLSGIPRAERRERATAALRQVGLGDQLKKKPSEMSGGQMQRVAIARAIVNRPEIILADEPTGALDTETSVQVMEILRELAQDHLVIMVTHNPELAERYSTRIVRMLDGRVIDDSAPPLLPPHPVFSHSESRRKRPSLKLSTGFSLSLKNLFSKKGRTLLTSFAGSIGIIGIALVYAVSAGMTDYINTVQEDTLSSYPLTLESRHMDISSLVETFMGKAQSSGEHEMDAVYEKTMLYSLVHSLSSSNEQENDLAAFKTYLEALEQSDPERAGAVSGVRYAYGADLLVYTESESGQILRSDTSELMTELVTEYMGATMASMMQGSQEMQTSFFSSAYSSSTMWEEMLSGQNGETINPLLKKQYDLVYGEWPSAYNEVLLVVDERNELSDLTLYALGLKSKEEISEIMKAAVSESEISVESQSWTFEQICDREFRVILPGACYQLDEASGTYVDLRDTSAGLKYLYDNGETIRVSGIIRKNPDAVSGMLQGSIAYTSGLTERILNRAEESDAVNDQLSRPDTDIFTGLPFPSDSDSLDETERAERFLEIVEQQTEAERAKTYRRILSTPSEETLQNAVDSALGAMDRAAMEEQMRSALALQTGISSDKIDSYLAAMSDDDLKSLFADAIRTQVKEQQAAQVEASLAGIPEETLAAQLQSSMDQWDTSQLASFYENALEFSESTLKENLIRLGRVDLSDPSEIHLYAATFADKDEIKAIIDDYNSNAPENHEIRYTDYVGLIMSSVTTIINAITYVLIGFVAVSLIVSSIMIGVITLISVQERTKEIGILRALGASKRNVSTMFNAETMIIGFASGLIGVLVTYLLCIPINLILHSLTGISNLSAFLPPQIALLLVVVSTLLTLISGIIPSRSAARKDPVVALRTE